MLADEDIHNIFSIVLDNVYALVFYMAVMFQSVTSRTWDRQYENTPVRYSLLGILIDVVQGIPESN